MSRTTVTRTIDAPLESVFEAVSRVENFQKAVPEIIKVEFLSEVTSGVGTRFRETRLMGKKEASTELEITECVPNEHVRIVSDTAGTHWDSVFTVKPASPSGVELTLVMDAKAQTMSAKLMNPLIKGVIEKALERDMDAVKAFCEG